LKRAGSSQLSFAFADSPQGGKSAEAVDASAAEAWLLHTADDKAANEPAAQAEVQDEPLLERAASMGNLARALLNVARNKGAAGVDGRSVDEMVEHARTLLPKLRRSLLTGDYQPGATRRVWIPKPGAPGSVRGLGIPNVVDRVVQQALLQVLEPVFEPTFHDSSHGFRPRRGASTAVAEAKVYVEQGYDHVVDVDLSKFFDRVNHQRLLGRMAQRVKDGRVLKLVHQMLKAKVVMPDGTVVSTPEGTPQGGPLSPLLSNIVLDELDQELERRGLRFVRYADDFMVFVRSERAGHRVMACVQRFIEGRLRLKVNPDKSRVDRPENLHFLGFTLRRGRDSRVEVYLSQRSVQRINDRVRELTPRTWGGSLRSCMDRLNRYLRGWYGYFRLCTESGARHFGRIDGHVRRRLRAIIVRQKGRRPRFLFRHLRSRGVSAGSAARTAYRRRGVWFQSSTYGMHKAYGNAWFYDRVATLWRLWEQENHAPTWVSSRQLGLFG
jgi:group II intron reverse transcriptase/maturase